MLVVHESVENALSGRLGHARGAWLSLGRLGHARGA